jgi:hypothetical protein
LYESAMSASALHDGNIDRNGAIHLQLKYSSAANADRKQAHKQIRLKLHTSAIIPV